MKRLKSSDNEKSSISLEELYSSYEKKMYYIAFSILNNRQQAEDTVQDAFIKIMKYMPQINRGKRTMTTSLVVNIIRNTAIDRYRRNQKESQLFGGEIDESIADYNDELISHIETDEEQQYLNNLLHKIKPIDREIITMKCFYELSTKDIAQKLKITEEAVRKRYQRAKENVKQAMGDDLSE